MSIFSKGDFKAVSHEFRDLGITSLQELSKFQEKFEIYDTDTTINGIRDAIVANYLNFDLLNFGKHGFDAKKSTINQFLEIKYCSISSENWAGTWNEPIEKKTEVFKDSSLFTAVAIWKGASDLQFMIYGQNLDLVVHLKHLVVNIRNDGKSIQTVAIQKLVKDFGFDIICPPDKTKEYVLNLLINYHRKFIEYVSIADIKTIQDIQ